jgi:hypothetical protein
LCHCSDDILKELAEHGIFVMTSQVHISDFSGPGQPPFGRLKATKKYLSRDFDIPTSLDHVMRVFQTYEIATTGTTTRAS